MYVSLGAAACLEEAARLLFASNHPVPLTADDVQRLLGPEQLGSSSWQVRVLTTEKQAFNKTWGFCADVLLTLQKADGTVTQQQALLPLALILARCAG